MTKTAGDPYLTVRIVKSHRWYWVPKFTRGIGYQFHWGLICVILYPKGKI